MRQYLKHLVVTGCFVLCMSMLYGCGNSSSSEKDAAEMTTAVALGQTDGYSDEEDCVDNIEDVVETEGDEVLIPEEPVPLGPGTDSKTTTTKSSKTTKTKKTKKKAAKKSKTVTNTRTKKKTSSSTTKEALVVKVTTTVTTQKTKYKKGSKVLNITTKVDTTVATTTTPIEQGEMDINSAAKKADARLLKRFTDEGYKYVVDTGLSSIGLFSSRNKQLTLRYYSDVIYHELGHYLAYTTGKTDYTSEFKAIYRAEMNNYTGDNKVYVIQNCSEYFAESYRDYVTRPSTLQSQRPQTYAYIQKVLEML